MDITSLGLTLKGAAYVTNSQGQWR